MRRATASLTAMSVLGSVHVIFLLLTVFVVMANHADATTVTLSGQSFNQLSGPESLSPAFNQRGGQTTVNAYSGLVEVLVSGLGFDNVNDPTSGLDAFYSVDSLNNQDIGLERNTLRLGSQTQIMGNPGGYPFVPNSSAQVEAGSLHVAHLAIAYDGSSFTVADHAYTALVPIYNPDHVYHFVMDLRSYSGTLTFGVGDGGVYDNSTNSYNISLWQVGQEAVLSGVPDYFWHRGCAPTSATMIMAYWDRNGYSNLWDGTPQTSNAPYDNDDPVNMVITHMGDLMDTDTDPNSGATKVYKIPRAIKEFAEEQDSTYKFKAGNKYASDRVLHPGSWFEGFSFDYLKKEIDAGRPMHIGLKGDQLDADPNNRWGHSVVAYGYQDNPGTSDDWFAVRDTWLDGNSNGDGGIVAKSEDGIEWWKWTTDTKQDYYVFMGSWIIPATDGNAGNTIWGILESTFSSEAAFEDQFEVRTGASGEASLVTLSAAPEETTVRLLADGVEGTDDCILVSWIPMSDVLNISFDYAFETAGSLEVLINGQLMAEVTDLSGSGVVDDLDDFQTFCQEFTIGDWGLDPNETYELELRLLAGSTHIAFLDNLQVIDPGATPFVPEPSVVVMLLFGVALLAGHPFTRSGRRVR